MEKEECLRESKKLEKYIPSLEIKIRELQGAKTTNLKLQLRKMQSLYSLITDRAKKYNINIFKKCGDVLFKLFPNVDSNGADEPLFQTNKQFAENNSQRFENKSAPNEESIFDDYSTPTSPSPPRELPPSYKPIRIPTKKIASNDEFSIPSLIFEKKNLSPKSTSDGNSNNFDRTNCVDTVKPLLTEKDLEELQSNINPTEYDKRGGSEEFEPPLKKIKMNVIPKSLTKLKQCESSVIDPTPNLKLATAPKPVPASKPKMCLKNDSEPNIAECKISTKDNTKTDSDKYERYKKLFSNLKGPSEMKPPKLIDLDIGFGSIDMQLIQDRKKDKKYYSAKTDDKKKESDKGKVKNDESIKKIRDPRIEKIELRNKNQERSQRSQSDSDDYKNNQANKDFVQKEAGKNDETKGILPKSNVGLENTEKNILKEKQEKEEKLNKLPKSISDNKPSTYQRLSDKYNHKPKKKGAEENKVQDFNASKAAQQPIADSFPGNDVSETSNFSSLNFTSSSPSNEQCQFENSSNKHAPVKSYDKSNNNTWSDRSSLPNETQLSMKYGWRRLNDASHGEQDFLSHHNSPTTYKGHRTTHFQQPFVPNNQNAASKSEVNPYHDHVRYGHTNSSNQNQYFDSNSFNQSQKFNSFYPFEPLPDRDDQTRVGPSIFFPSRQNNNEPNFPTVPSIPPLPVKSRLNRGAWQRSRNNRNSYKRNFNQRFNVHHDRRTDTSFNNCNHQTKFAEDFGEKRNSFGRTGRVPERKEQQNVDQKTKYDEAYTRLDRNLRETFSSQLGNLRSSTENQRDRDNPEKQRYKIPKKKQFEESQKDKTKGKNENNEKKDKTTDKNENEETGKMSEKSEGSLVAEANNEQNSLDNLNHLVEGCTKEEFFSVIYNRLSSELGEQQKMSLQDMLFNSEPDKQESTNNENTSDSLNPIESNGEMKNTNVKQTEVDSNAKEAFKTGNEMINLQMEKSLLSESGSTKVKSENIEKDRTAETDEIQENNVSEKEISKPKYNNDNLQSNMKRNDEEIETSTNNKSGLKKRKKKSRTELEMLQDDIQQMFIRDGVLMANGKRICRKVTDNTRVLNTKSNGSEESTKSNIPEKDIKKTDEDTVSVVPKVPKGKTLNMKKSVVPTLNEEISNSDENDIKNLRRSKRTSKKPTNYFELHSFGEGTDCSKHPSSSVVKPIKTIVKHEEDTNEIKGEVSTSMKELKKYNKRNVNVNLTDSKKSVSTTTKPDDNNLEKNFLCDNNSNPAKPKSCGDALYVPDINYYYDVSGGRKPSCKLCVFARPWLVSHYRRTHKDSEVMISRLPPNVTADAIANSVRNDYENFVDFELHSASKFNFKCIFCHVDKEQSAISFFDHLTTHTGEYRFSCKFCPYVCNDRKPLNNHYSNIHKIICASFGRNKPDYEVANYSIVFGYVCSECNYLQLSKEAVKQHIENYHFKANIKIYKINMSLKSISVESNVEMINNEIVEDAETKVNEEEEEEAEKINVQQVVENKKAMRQKRIRFNAKKRRFNKNVKQNNYPNKEVNNVNSNNITEEIPEDGREEKQSIEINEPAFDKPIAKNIFMCDAEMVRKEQEIDDERRKKMEEINQSVSQKRVNLSFTEKLKTLLEKPTDIAEANVNDKLSTEKNIEPEINEVVETYSTDRNEEEEEVKSIENFQCVKSVKFQQVQTKNKPIFSKITSKIASIIQRLQGKLENGRETIKVGQLEGIRNNDGVVYRCLIDNCDFETSLENLFENHCTQMHPYTIWDGFCKICNKFVNEKEGSLFMLDAYQHLAKVHIGSKKVESTHENFCELNESYDIKEPSMYDEKLVNTNENFELLFEEQKPEATEDNHNFPFQISSVSTLTPEDELKLDGADVKPINRLSLPEHKVTTQPDNFVNLAISTPPDIYPSVQNSTASNQVMTVVRLKESTTELGDGIKEVLINEIPLSSKEISHIKSDYAMQCMLSVHKMQHLYKCPRFTCVFTNSISEIFFEHLQKHVDIGELDRTGIPCIYCPFKIQLEQYMIHVDMKHGNCQFGCTLCFYRAVCQSYVQLHIHQSHSKTVAFVYKIPPTKTTYKVSLPCNPSLKEILPLINCPHCQFVTLFVEEYVNHAKYDHRILGNVCFKCNVETGDLLNLENHLEKHNIFRFYCRYCTKGATSSQEIYAHLASTHPSSSPEIIKRKFVPDSSGRKPVNYDYKENEIYSRLGRIVRENPVWLDPDILHDYTAEITFGIMTSPGTVSSTSGVQPTPKFVSILKSNNSIIGNNNLSVMEDVQEVILNGRKIDELDFTISEEVNKEVQNLSITEEIDNDPLAEKDPLEISATDFENSQTEVVATPAFYVETDSDEFSSNEVVSLSGCQLFICSICKFGFPSSSQFRSHVAKCSEIIGESMKSFRCIHCPKIFKSSNALTDHIRIHGTAKFTCSLCDYYVCRSKIYVQNHMKSRHKSSNYVITPIDPNKNDFDKDQFIIRPKRFNNPEVVNSGERNSPHPDTQMLKTTFSPKEIHLLPRQSIYNVQMKCSLCPYVSKVKTNLVRHLTIHERQKLAPVNEPINPVPCLNKNEKMFDKMINLAFASNTHSKTGSKSFTQMGLTKEEEEKLPAYVPTTKRYVCGVKGCNYLCLEDSMLRHHLLALHAHENEYKCTHCDQKFGCEKGSIDLDVVIKHYKLHDRHLYMCSICKLLHHLRHKIDRHLLEKHIAVKGNVIVVREIETELLDDDCSNNLSSNCEEYKEPKPWRCGICKYRCSMRNEIIAHVFIKHQLTSQYKCAICSYWSSSKDSFDEHFNVNHPGQQLDIIDTFYKVEEITKYNTKDSSFDTTPLWQRDRPRVKHIRGILLEDSKRTSKKSPIKIAPIATTTFRSSKLLDDSIEAVASGSCAVVIDIEEENNECEIITPILSTNSSTVPTAIEKQNTENQITSVASSSSIVLTTIENENIENEIIEIEDDSDEDDVGRNNNNEKGKIYRLSDIIKVSNEKLKTSDLIGIYGPFGKPTLNEYHCPLCAKFITKSQNDMIYHLYRELGYSKYMCMICKRRAMTFPFLEKHVLQAHNGENPAKIICSTATDHEMEDWANTVITVQRRLIVDGINKSQTMQHKQNMLQKSPVEGRNNMEVISVIEDDLPTNVPEAALMAAESSSSNVVSSKTLFNTVKMHHCSHCSYKTKYSTDIKKHEMRHWVEKPYKCGRCNFNSISNYEIVLHSKRRHQTEEALVIVDIPENPTIVPVIRNKRKRNAMSSSHEQQQQHGAKRMSPGVETVKHSSTPLYEGNKTKSFRKKKSDLTFYRSEFKKRISN